MQNAATRAATPAVTMLNELFAGLLRGLASLFEVSAPVDRETVLHRVLLFAVLCVGTFVRFWGLGVPGLHGDEETMAMATMHIVKDGLPILPSGMFYPRGLTELYLMAASVQIFGESEWAFRLPSALCGVAVIYLTFLAGRRFLQPHWNLALAATVALLPDLVEYSQTARMYIFMEACIAGCLVCIFAWERSDRIGWLAGAVLTLVVGIELHALSVTCVLLFMLPSVLHSDRRKFAYGLTAASTVMVAYLIIDGWANSQYPVPPPEYGAAIVATLRHGGAPVPAFPLSMDVALWVTGAATALFAVHFGRVVHERLPSFLATALLLAALAAQLMFSYHIAVLLGVTGSVIAFRYREQRAWRRFLRFALAAAVVGLIHVTVLASQPGSVVKLVGMLVGQPSVWQYARISELSRVAALLVVVATIWGLWRLANRRRVPDYWLLALLGVWIPMFMLGCFTWNLPSRYTSASLLPMLLCAFAFAQHALDALMRRLQLHSAVKPLQAAALLASVVLIVNPIAASASFGPHHLPLPDHKGAALFMRAQHLTADDVVLAEDVLEQTYYLGSVDYWLIARKHARRYVQQVDGKIRDFYTNTPVIDNGADLAALLDRYPDRRIYVIGSGENRADDRREMRADGIGAVLNTRFAAVYVGRDDYTTVWLARPRPKAVVKRPAPLSDVAPARME
jgi:dolichyl-phosphate-mannose-protein mannosyltransferase